MSIQETLRYGAFDLKESYNRNLGIAFLLSIGLHLLLIGLYGILAKKDFITAPLIRLPEPGRTIIRDIVFPPEPPSVPPSGPSSGGPEPLVGGMAGASIKADVGTPIPSVVDTNDIVPITVVPIASPIGGNGIGDPFIGGNGGGGNGNNEGGGTTPNNGVSIPNAAGKTDPDPTDYIHVEEEPKWDQGDLQRRVKYPEIARRNNIEGMVVVQVLIDRTGKPVKTMILSSDNKILEEASRDAVMRTVFTPAIQNGVPVAVWVQVPIVFQLQ